MQHSEANQLYRIAFVLIAFLLAGAAFLFVIHTFIIDIVVAAIFAGLLTPVFEQVLPLFGHKKGAAAAAILLGTILVIGIPLAVVLTIVVSEAFQVSGAAVAWIEQTVAHPEIVLRAIPSRLVATKEFQITVGQLSAHIGDMVGVLSGYVSVSLSFVAREIGRLFLDLFVTSFAFAYFLQNGAALKEELVERIPIERNEASAIVKRTLQITAATLRGIVVGGVADGVLVGTGFAVVGLGEPWFWGAITVVASQTPVLGSAVVWIPAAGYLLLTGHLLPALGIALWGTAINTVVDNFLRVYVIGHGSAMPGFLVLVSTLGGIAALGPVGVLVGPVLTGVLIAVFDLYVAALRSAGISGIPA